MWKSRTELLIGENGVKKLDESSILLFGLGGVGSFVFEALVRAGIGRIDVCDYDVIDETNINRQLFALRSTVGKKKTQLAVERAKGINSEIEIKVFDCFYSNETENQFDFSQYSYVIDAIDTVTSKILIIENCKASGIPIISAMGTGRKLCTDFFITDIYSTSGCPLARVLRRELKKRGIEKLKVVASKTEAEPCENAKILPSISFAPSSAGLAIACEVVKDLLK